MNCRRISFPSSLLTPEVASSPVCVPYSLPRLNALTSRCLFQVKVLSDLLFGDGELAEGARPAQASWGPISVDFSGRLAPPYLQGSVLSHESFSGRMVSPKEASRVPSYCPDHQPILPLGPTSSHSLGWQQLYLPPLIPVACLKSTAWPQSDEREATLLDHGQLHKHLPSHQDLSWSQYNAAQPLSVDLVSATSLRDRQED